MLCKLGLQRPLQKPWTINVTLDQTRTWSLEKDKNRIKVKKTTAKTDQTTWEKAEVCNILTGQSSSGLLGKTTNTQKKFYSKIINRSYMIWLGKVWLLRKIDKDCIMIIIRHVYSLLEARWFWLYEEVRLTCFPKTIAFISKCLNRDK